MKEFFRSWRRRVGCITLMMALAIVALWMRGQFVGDLIVVPSDTRGLTFGTGYFGFGVEFSEVEVPSQAFSWRTFPKPTFAEIAEGDRYNAAVYGPNRYWRWGFSGLQMEKVNDTRRIGVSHWWLIVPLTFLSAYLILWKPRQA